MAKINWKEMRERAKSNETHQLKEKLWTNRIVKIIILSIVAILLIAGIGGFWYISRSLGPVNPENDKAVEVTLPLGSSTNDVASILKEHDLVHNDTVFSFYMKAKNVSDLQAGHYEFNQSMTADDVIAQLTAGGEPIFVDADTKITINEGLHLEQIADLVAEETPYEAEEFMALVNDEAFIQILTEKFPTMLEGLLEIEELKYPLEGYLYPATYDYMAGTSLEDLVTQMVATTNLEFQKIREDLDQTWMTFHEVLTLASIVEREGITDEDRALIAGVFLNRINEGMPLQSDITVLYALGEHKELVTYSDLETESPYNLYMYSGLAPGPFNSPSLSSIMAVIYPTYSDYYYFVADLDTQEIYYSTNIEDHDALVEEYVNSRFNDETEEDVVEDEEVPVEEVVDEEE